MQIIYTWVRPDTSIQFFDFTMPGFREYIDALYQEGYNIQNNLSPDGLTLTSTYTFANAQEIVDYDIFIDQYAAVREADTERRHAMGITCTKEIVE